MENYILILLLVTSGICFVDCHFGIARKLLETFNICRDVQNLKTYQALLMKLRESRLSIIMNSYMIYNRSNNSYSKRLFNGFLLKNASFASSDISEARTCNDTIVAESILHKHGDFNIHTNVDVTNDTCCHDIFQLSKMFESMHFPISFIGLMCLCFQLCFHPCFQTFADLLQSFCGLNIGTGKTNLTLQIQKIIHEKQNKYFSKFFSKLRDLCNRDMIDSLLKKELSPRPQQSMEDENLDQEGNSFGHKRTYYPCRRCFRMLTAKRLFQQNRNEIFGLFPEPKHKNIHDLYCQGFCEVTYQIQASRQTLCDSLKLFISRALLFSDLYNTLDIVAANAYQAKVTEFQTMQLYSCADWRALTKYKEMKRVMAYSRREINALENYLENFQTTNSQITSYVHKILMEYQFVIDVFFIAFMYIYFYVNSFITFNLHYRSKIIIIKKNKRKYRPMKNGPLICWRKTRLHSKSYSCLIIQTKRLMSVFKKKNLVYIITVINVFFKTLPIPLKSNHIIHEQLNAAESAVVEEAEITSSLEKTSGNKKEDREKSDDLLSAIRGTDVSAWARDNVTLYPVYKQTLDSFFKQSVEENLGNNSNAYKFEMIRLATFSNFGAHIPASSVSLAKAGFYATGSSNECKCFSCGISYSNWREWDNPFDIHRQISPSCSFINGTETDNICIQKHGDSTSSGNGNSNMGCNGISETTSSITENLQSANTVLQNGSMNTSEQPAVNQLNQSHTREHAIGNLNNTEETTRVRTPQMPSRNIPDLANSNERSESTRMSEQQRRKQTDNAQSGSRSANHDKYNQLGINFDKPKYPSYAVLLIRVSSFHGWPSGNGQEPKSLALAGFFYAGYSDYCRCFFCGGGLRNWDHGDDPWVEHGRWFPNCVFILQNKGPEFVSLALQKNTESEENNRLGHSENESESRKELKRREICIQTVMEMGYPRDLIDTAISELQHNGQNKFDAALLLETVFCIEERLKSGKQQQLIEEDIEGATGFVSTQNLDTNTTYINDVSQHIKSVKLDDTEGLVEENSRLRAQRLCRICREEDATVAFLPCGHLVCCYHCAPALVKCCVCNNLVKGTVKTWFV